MSSDCYYGDRDFVDSVINTFTVEDCLEFFHSIGIYPKEKNGYYYPNSEQAASVAEALCEELERLQVSIYYDITVKELHVTGKEVSVSTETGDFVGERLVIATGLLASPKLGSDGSLFDAIKSLGNKKYWRCGKEGKQCISSDSIFKESFWKCIKDKG